MNFHEYFIIYWNQTYTYSLGLLDYLGPFRGSLGTYGLIWKLCLKKYYKTCSTLILWKIAAKNVTKTNMESKGVGTGIWGHLHIHNPPWQKMNGKGKEDVMLWDGAMRELEEGIMKDLLM